MSSRNVERGSSQNQRFLEGHSQIKHSMSNTDFVAKVNYGRLCPAANGESRVRTSAKWLGSRFVTLAYVLVLLSTAYTTARATDSVAGEPNVASAAQLETGFHLLYDLKPAEAKTQFEAWEKSHPEDPLGNALEAANYLLEECYRQGVLTSEFFLAEKRPADKKDLKPDPARRAGFFAAFQRAQELAQARLKSAPDDVNALFAMTLSLGMQANYTSLIENRQMESLNMMKDAARYAKQLLGIDANAADAYLALGAMNYMVGSLPGHQKFFLGFKGIHGDENAGIQQLQITATRGHYLRPFAKMLLGLAALRQKKPDIARTQFSELAAEFPSNPLFASELAKLSPVTASVARRGP